MMGDGPPKFIKSEADFIPEKEKIFIMGHTKLLSYSSDHSQRSGFWNCGNGGCFGASSYYKIKHQIWAEELLQPWSQA